MLTIFFNIIYWIANKPNEEKSKEQKQTLV